MMTCTFISQSIVLLDLPHQMGMRFYNYLYRKDEEFERFRKANQEKMDAAVED